MKFIIKKLELVGFKTFVERATLDFMALGPGLHYLKGLNKARPSLGSNGAGKSSLWDALCWACTGRTADGLRGPDIRPWAAYKGPTTVKIEAEIDGKARTIVRSQSPNLLTLDGREVQQASLDKLVGQSFAFIAHAIVMGQGVPLFFNRSPKEKMALFSEVLALDRWERRSEYAASKFHDRQKLAVQIAADIDGHQSNLTTLDNLIKDLRVSSNKWQEQHDKELATLEKDMKRLSALVDKMRAAFDAATLAADSAGTEAKALVKEVDARRDDLASARHFYNKAELRLNSLRIQWREMKHDLDKMGSGGKCPTCGQITKGTAFAKHQESVRKKVEAIKSECDKGIPVKLTGVVNNALIKLNAAIDHRNKFLAKEEAAQKVVSSKRFWIAQHEAENAVLKRQLASGEEAKNPHRAELSKLRKQRDGVRQDIEDCTARLKKLEALAARTKFWVKGFKDIRLLVIDEVLQHLEMATNALLDEVGLFNWCVQYAIDKETKTGKVRDGLNVLILSPGLRKPVKWECWSGGEGQRLLVVGSLALSKVLLDYVGIETNLEILDEPTQYIGEEGIEDIIELLSERARRLKRTIVYTDHGARESALFTSTITVTRTKAGSRVNTT